MVYSTWLGCEKYFSYWVSVLQLGWWCITFGAEMYNNWMKDVWLLLYAIIILNLHSAFSVSSASSLSEGDSGWKHCFTTPSLTYFERGQVVSVLSALTYGLNFVSPELNFIIAELKSVRLRGESGELPAYFRSIKRRVCSDQTEGLFALDTGSVYLEYRLCLR